MSVRWSSVVAAAGVALLLAACGGSSGSTDEADAAGHGGSHMASESLAGPVEGATEITIRAVDLDFEPASLEIPAGEPVNLKIVNDGQALHDFTVEFADVHVNVEPGETKTTSLTIDKPGHYEAICTVAGHAEAGMTIDVSVSA